MIVRGKNIIKKRFQSNLQHDSKVQGMSSGELCVNCVVKVTWNYLSSFYIFKVEQIGDDYIKLCKGSTCMAMQTKAWLTYFIFKKNYHFSISQFLVIFFNPIKISYFRHAWITCYAKTFHTSIGIWFKYGHLTSSHISCFTTPRCRLFQAIRNCFQERKKKNAVVKNNHCELN
jgi:hypothetical protein